MPPRLSETPPRQRTRATLAETRRQPLVEQQLEEIELFERADEVSSLADLQRHLGEAQGHLPQGFLVHHCAESSRLLLFKLSPLGGPAPSISASVVVSCDLSWTVAVAGKRVSKSAFLGDLLPPKLTRFTQLQYLMARVAHVEADPAEFPYLDTAVSTLEAFLSAEPTDGQSGDDQELRRKVAFLLEQLKLSLLKPKGRRYPPELLIFAYILNAKSAAAYRELLAQNMLCLPSQRLLNKLTGRLGSKLGDTTDGYLAARCNKSSLLLSI